MAPEPTFEMHVIESGLTDGYWIQAMDVDGDGRPDILTSGLSDGHVSWYRNPDWIKHAIHDFPRPVSLDQGDVSGSGRRDLVICHDYARTMFVATPADGKISWMENPGEAGGDWTPHPVGQLGSTHRLRLGHFTNPEELQLLALPVVGQKSGLDALHAPIKVMLYHRPDDALKADSWAGEPVDETSFRVIHAAQLGNFGAPSPAGLDAVLLACEEGLVWFGVDETALDEPIDDALDRRHVHRRFAPKVALRTGLQILELHECCPLGGRQLFGNQAGKDGDVALVGLAQIKADLFTERIVRLAAVHLRA